MEHSAQDPELNCMENLEDLPALPYSQPNSDNSFQRQQPVFQPELPHNFAPSQFYDPSTFPRNAAIDFPPMSDQQFSDPSDFFLDPRLEHDFGSLQGAQYLTPIPAYDSNITNASFSRSFDEPSDSDWEAAIKELAESDMRPTEEIIQDEVVSDPIDGDLEDEDDHLSQAGINEDLEDEDGDPSQAGLPVWNPSITTPDQARAWLAAHPLGLEQVFPENDDALSQHQKQAEHVRSLFYALSQAPPKANPHWRPDKIQYYDSYQATAMDEVTAWLSTKNGCDRAQSQCVLIIEQAYLLHGAGISPSRTKMKLDSKSKLSKRISQIIAVVQIKRVAMDIVEDKPETMKNVVRNPCEVLKTREHCVDNNSKKKLTHDAGTVALSKPVKKSKHTEGLHPSSPEVTTGMAKGNKPIKHFGASPLDASTSFSSHTTSPSVLRFPRQMESPYPLVDDSGNQVQRPNKRAGGSLQSEETSAWAKRRKSKPSSGVDSGYATPTAAAKQAMRDIFSPPQLSPNYPEQLQDGFGRPLIYTTQPPPLSFASMTSNPYQQNHEAMRAPHEQGPNSAVSLAERVPQYPRSDESLSQQQSYWPRPFTSLQQPPMGFSQNTSGTQPSPSPTMQYQEEYLPESQGGMSDRNITNSSPYDGTHVDEGTYR